jgi:sulfite reductase (ferredoxin)
LIYGERAKRLKARMKFLIKDIGRDEFMRLVDEEKAALSYQIIEIDTTDFDVAIPETLLEVPKVTIEDTVAFETWKNQMS